MFFFEKKHQSSVLPAHACHGSKVFCFFFSKKKAFLE